MVSSKKRKPSIFESIATTVTKASGGTSAFIIASAIIIIWLVTGPVFGFSDTWQLVINTGTTIVTFLMVFLIQRSQNKDSMAVHLKLNELIVAIEMANNRLIAVEDISEDDLKHLHIFYQKLAEMASKEMSVEESHSKFVADFHHKRKRTALSKHKLSDK